MNGFKNWVVRSREQQKKSPERYLGSYPELVMDEMYVLMTPGLRKEIKSACGQYDGTIPSGVYLGKMFLRGDCLCWFGICKERPMTDSTIQFRVIQMVE